MSSKRKSRDKKSRALSKGYKAGKLGRSKDSCHFATNSGARELWLTGWKLGWRETRYENYKPYEVSETYISLKQKGP